MKTIYLTTKLVLKVFISSKICRLFFVPIFSMGYFILLLLNIEISYKVKNGGYSPANDGEPPHLLMDPGLSTSPNCNALQFYSMYIITSLYIFFKANFYSIYIFLREENLLCKHPVFFFFIVQIIM